MRVASLLVLVMLPGALAACANKHAATTAPSVPASNRPPVVRARCEPCTIAVGQTANVRVEAEDPDGDTLTYSWRAPAGSFATAAAARTAWTAPALEGPVFVTIRVEDGKGGSASDVITVTVVK